MMKVLNIILIFIAIVSAPIVNAQTRTVNGSGNWSSSGNWLGGNIGGDVDNDDDVVMGNAIDITIQNAESYTIATLNVSKDGSLTVDVGGVLIVSGTFNGDKTFTVNVDGDLTIQGDLLVAKDLILNVTGNLIIEGSVNVAKDASFDVQGSMTVEGDFIAAKDATLNVDGSLNVTGDLTLGTGSVITGPIDAITVGGACGIVGSICPGTVTPIELMFFSGKSERETVSLNWATAIEENFDYFEIERASQGTSFELIAEVKGDGNSFTRLDYYFIDESPEIGLNYYRLKSIDLDGTYEYSEVILVKFTSNVKLVVSPNPTFGVISVRTSIPTTDGLKYEVTNQYGVVVLTGSLSTFNSQIDLQGLTKGIYIIRLIDLPSVKAQRIILK